MQEFNAFSGHAEDDKIIDDTLDGLHKTVAIFEGRHVETVENIKGLEPNQNANPGH